MMNPRPFKRIMIFGIPGSGKSTFAVQLGDLLGLPVHHLDRYFFVENWVERDYEEFLQIQKQLVEEEKWIIDGNAIHSLEMRYSKADAVLYFHFNRWLCLYRVLKRFFSINEQISDRADGCSEKIHWRLIRYLWGFDKRVSQDLKELKQRYPHAVFHEFLNDRDVRTFLENQIKIRQER